MTRPPGVGPDRAVGSVLVLLGARNVSELMLPAAAYVPTNVVVAAVLLAAARGSGSSWGELGLSRCHVRRGLAVGSAAAAGAVTAMLVAAAAPRTGRLFDDERVPRDADAGERLYQTVVRIPVGTVAFEELAFRGVLLTVLCRRLRPPAAVALDSTLFGLWHIVPTLATARANGIVGLGRLGVVAASVLATAAGGAVLCALRMRAGHLLAPALLHLGFNDAGYLLAWRVRSRAHPTLHAREGMRP
ncbi:MAG: CPBP family intramembrane metalloprotease [Actinomycetota bacterium]|nr:CPBP family intramembrane metalloprotease [Actinomycetota bacterium]